MADDEQEHETAPPQQDVPDANPTEIVIEVHPIREGDVEVVDETA